MKLSFKSYIRYLRKQHVHVQRVHATIFAGVVCLLVGSAILYAEYGYWHTTYIRQEEIAQEDSTVLTESPLATLSRLLKEGKERFLGVTSTLKPVLENQGTFDRNATTTP